ncbi:MAG: hypothetical protein ACQXXF_07410, partial [Thermoplasmatota archaeon]
MKTSKQRFLIVFFIVFCLTIVSSFGQQSQNQLEETGCCVAPDYSIILNRNENDCKNLGYTYFNQRCEEISYFNTLGCCIKSGDTGQQCAYLTQAWCQYQGEGANFVPKIKKDECSNFENQFGNCVTDMFENCTKNFQPDKCIEGTIFYCNRITGTLIPNCNLCKNCAPFVCDQSTGKCDLGK